MIDSHSAFIGAVPINPLSQSMIDTQTRSTTHMLTSASFLNERGYSLAYPSMGA